MSAHDARCEFRSVRSRITWQLIGGFGAAFFIAFLGFVAAKPPSNHGSEVTIYYICAFGLAWSAAAVFNSYRSGTLIMSDKGLIYRSSLRNRRFDRANVTGAQIELRFTPPSPRRVNIPVISLQGGRKVQLTDLATPLSRDLKVLKSMIEVDEDREWSMASLDDLADWINSWSENEDWIVDANQIG